MYTSAIKFWDALPTPYPSHAMLPLRCWNLHWHHQAWCWPFHQQHWPHCCHNLLYSTFAVAPAELSLCQHRCTKLHLILCHKVTVLNLFRPPLRIFKCCSKYSECTNVINILKPLAEECAKFSLGVKKKNFLFLKKMSGSAGKYSYPEIHCTVESLSHLSI